MPLTVYKYILDAGVSMVPMPRGAKVLSVAHEPRPLNGGEGGVFLYALVDPEEPSETRAFALTGTGQEIEGLDVTDLGPFVGTVSISPFYFHVFELLT